MPVTFAAVLPLPASLAMCVVFGASLVVALVLVAWVHTGAPLPGRRRRASDGRGSPGHLRARAIAAAERKGVRTEIAIGLVLFVIYACALAADRHPQPQQHHDDAAIVIGR